MNPVLAEVLRGDRLESAHRGAVAVFDADGGCRFSTGDIDRPVYPRSAVKPLQALPLIASGTASQLNLTDAEIAIACGSHAGEPQHITTVTGMLAKAGMDPSSLECGTHWPLSEAAARLLAAHGQTPSALHNNCSGKHAGFLCVARIRGADPAGYVRPGHPVMREVTRALAEITGVSLDESSHGIDGCSIPTFAIPLKSLALAFARLGTGVDLSPPLAAAAARILAAMAGHPEMLAGTGRFDTRVNSCWSGLVICKSGAEGVAAATIPSLGLGIALKVDDGAPRAAEVAMTALLERFPPSPASGQPTAAPPPPDAPLRNWNDVVVGNVRASAALREHCS
jgi:L-asparaginase II